MKKLLETMYITTPDSYAFLRNENICIEVGGEERASVPASQVDSIVFISKNTVSTGLMAFCGKNDITMYLVYRSPLSQGRELKCVC